MRSSGSSAASRHSTQPTPSGARPNLCPEVLIDLTRGTRKSHTTSGAQKGARKAPLAPSTWMSMSRPVSSLELVEGLGELEHRLVGAGVGDAEGGHHHDGVLVDPLEHLLHVHAVAPRGHGDLAHLDVPVLGELVPDHLHRPAHHVGRVGRLPGGPALGPPAPLGRHPAEHAGLGGPDGRAADRLLGLGRVPQVGQHVRRSAARSRPSGGTRPCR